MATGRGDLMKSARQMDRLKENMGEPDGRMEKGTYILLVLNYNL